jgi:hypothetical protein
MLVSELQEQLLTDYPNMAYVTDQGYTYTHRHGFLVIEWQADQLDHHLLHQLEQDERVKDLFVYTLAVDEQAPILFGSIVAHESKEAHL